MRLIQYIRNLFAMLLLACCSFAAQAQNEEEGTKVVDPPSYEYKDNNDEGSETSTYEKRYYDTRRLNELRSQREFQYDKTYEENSERLREISDREYFSDSSRRMRRQEEGAASSRSGSRNGSKEQSSSSSREKSSSSPRSSSGSSGNVLLILLLFAALVIILMIVLKLRPGSLFRRSAEKDLAPVEEAAEDIHKIHFESELDKAIRLKNFRLALRIMYLETLKKLTDKNMIAWRPEKTNWDYVRELNDPQLKKPFTEITNAYDYAWYGEFAIDEPLFRMMQDKMNTFRKTMGN